MIVLIGLLNARGDNALWCWSRLWLVDDCNDCLLNAGGDRALFL